MSINLSAANRLQQEIAATQQDINALREGMATCLITELQMVYQRLVAAIDDGEKLRAERKLVMQKEEPVPPELLEVDRRILQVSSKIMQLQREIQCFSYGVKKSEVREELLKIRGDFERFMRHTHTIRYSPKDIIHLTNDKDLTIETKGPEMPLYTRKQHIPGRGVVEICMWPKEIDPREFEI